MIDENLIHQLADPSCYPDTTPGLVTLYQTHLSVVVVAGEHAYKLKKPVRLPFVDFSTLELRKQFCEEEVRLNSRLCPEVYLGVAPLFATAAGPSFRDHASAEIIDYAVLMRRLPPEKMMDVMLAEDKVTRDDVRTIAETMAKFHRRVALPGDSPQAIKTATRLREFAVNNFDETAAHLDTIFDAGLHRLMHDRTRREFDRSMPALEARARAGRVVDGHGDLHARNICLCDPLAIYDCIEFNRDLRVQDVAAENAFLAMDLRYRGHTDLASAYLDHYVAIADDPRQRELVPMLVRYRAMVRAKVAAIAAGEREIDPADRDGCIGSARRHLNLVAASAIEEAGPCLICACGLPASGKTYVFEAIARTSGWPCFTSDVIRKELAGVGPNERAPETCYTAEFSARTYAEMMRRASAGLAAGPVLLDANFPSAALRQQAIASARQAGARVAFIWFPTDEPEIEQRMQERAADLARVSDADIDVYRKLRTSFEPPTDNEDATLVTAEASENREQKVASILRQLLEHRQQ